MSGHCGGAGPLPNKKKKPIPSKILSLQIEKEMVIRWQSTCDEQPEEESNVT
jgi:hypothetical protein